MSKKKNTQVTEIIQHIRQFRGMNMLTLSINTGIPQDTLKDYECGRKSPTTDELFRICEACDFKLNLSVTINHS